MFHCIKLLKALFKIINMTFLQFQIKNQIRNSNVYMHVDASPGKKKWRSAATDSAVHLGTPLPL